MGKCNLQSHCLLPSGHCLPHQLMVLIVNEEDGGDRIRARDITTDSRQWRTHVFARLGTTAKTTNEIQTLQRLEFAEMKNRIRRLEERIRVL